MRTIVAFALGVLATVAVMFVVNARAEQRDAADDALWRRVEASFAPWPSEEGLSPKALEAYAMAAGESAQRALEAAHKSPTDTGARLHLLRYVTEQARAQRFAAMVAA